VLRNHLAQRAIERAEALDFAEARALLARLETLGLAQLRVAWADLHGSYRTKTLVLGGPLMVEAFALDFIVQMTAATLYFWDRPRHWLVTNRLRAYMAGPPGWRRDRAEWLCTHMLDPIDPTGAHCD
jgi:hypothetical protein